MATIAQWYARLSRLAAEPEDDADLRLRKTMYFISSLLLGPLLTPWAALSLINGLPIGAVLVLVVWAVGWISIAIYLRTRDFGHFFRWPVLTYVLVTFVATLVFGGLLDSSAPYIWALLAPLAALVVHGPRQSKPWLGLYLALLVAATLLEPWLPAGNVIPAGQIVPLFVLNLGVVSVVIYLAFSYFVSQRNQAYALLAQERERSENLLLNVLPAEVAAELKQDRRTIARHYDSASVLFADLVGFSGLSAALSPAAMVDILNEVFTHFDMLVDRHGLAKIRTIGDNYMVAAGVPRPRPDHAQALADMALEMRDYLHSRPDDGGRPLVFRIGMNSGPLVAGVIGRRTYQYDLWGPTVNIASRMESHGAPGEVQISAATYELIKDEFVCDPRGPIQVKGLGELQTWFVVGRKPRPA